MITFYFYYSKRYRLYLSCLRIVSCKNCGNFSSIETCSFWGIDFMNRFKSSWNFIPCRIGIYLESHSLKILAFTGLMSWSRLWNISSLEKHNHTLITGSWDKPQIALDSQPLCSVNNREIVLRLKISIDPGFIPRLKYLCSQNNCSRIWESLWTYNIAWNSWILDSSLSKFRIYYPIVKYS